MRIMRKAVIRPLVGLLTIAAIAGIVGVAVGLFRGSFAGTVGVTVLSPRAGLVMDPDAKVRMLGVQVGRVASIEPLPDGQAAIHLAMDPARLQSIPSNVRVNIASTTVFGAKFVQLLPPPEPSANSLQPGQVLRGEGVTVELNTVFEQLNSLLAHFEPEKIGEVLGALAAAFNGRGLKVGQMLSDFDAYLATLEPSLPTLSRDLDSVDSVAAAYGDSAPDLMRIVDNTTTLSRTVVDQHHDLDALLVAAIGLGDVGTDVVGNNRRPLTDVLHLLVPTTDLTNRYNAALTCGLAGMLPILHAPPSPKPGIVTSGGLVLGRERYRYPTDLPKVAAKGGPHCSDIGLPDLPFGGRPPYVVADTGSNPWSYGNQGIVLNFAGLKEFLFGPIDGPPRNSAQIGQPG